MSETSPFLDRAFGGEARIRVYDEDPDLFDAVPHEARGRAVARVLTFDRGPLEPQELPEIEPESCLGLLVLDGLLVHSVVVGSDPRSELLGPGDVIRPWEDDAELASVPFESRWQVAHRARVAVLDARFVTLTCRWPSLMLAIVSRLVRRSRWLSLQLAIADLRRVDDRLMLFFWHLADRWGRVGLDGVVVPLPVTHDVLSQLVCAQRPTVTSALQRLATDGRLVRRPDRTWLLDPEPPPAPSRGRPSLNGARG